MHAHKHAYAYAYAYDCIYVFIHTYIMSTDPVPKFFCAHRAGGHAVARTKCRFGKQTDQHLQVSAWWAYQSDSTTVGTKRVQRVIERWR